MSGPMARRAARDGVMGRVEALVCPICGCQWQERRHEWRRGLAMAGRLPAWLWYHRRPDNRKQCCYSDAGPAGEPSPPAVAVAVAVAVGEERRAA